MVLAPGHQGPYLELLLAAQDRLTAPEIDITRHHVPQGSMVAFPVAAAGQPGECLAGALLDRLTHRAHILEANGESYRLREAKS